MLGIDRLGQALEALGEVLAARNLRYDLVAVGGSGLLLLGLIARSTRDLDVIAVVSNGAYEKAQPLPEELRRAVRDVGELMDIGAEWLNGAPADLLDLGLPAGFQQRTVTKTYGPLTIRLASRIDQVFFKLYAAVDNGPGSKHFQDLRELAPEPEELLAAGRWTITHDPSPDFKTELIGALKDLGVANAESRL